MKLIFPTIEYMEAALDFRQEHFDCGETVIHGDGGLDTAVTYEGWLESVRNAVIQNISEERVPATIFFGVHKDRIVGIIQIRYRLNKRLLESYGHIGYNIRPSERRKGYATRMLNLALEVCRGLGLRSVLISCDKDNIASIKTIQKVGGVFERAFLEQGGETVHQYWISIESSI